MTESILMVVYSSVNVPGIEFIALNGSLPGKSKRHRCAQIALSTWH